MDINVSWGSVVWLTLRAEVVKYDSLLGRTEAIGVSEPHIRCIPIHSMMPNIERTNVVELWVLLSSSIVWHLWKARCHRLLGKAFVPIAEIVSLIWQEMVLTLKARFDAIKGDSDAAMTRRNAFHRLWGKIGFYLIHRYSVRWMFSPPRWLFPAP